MGRKKKNLKVNITMVYTSITIFFIIGLAFFSTSKLFMAEDIEINQTELNKEYDLKSNGKFEISSWIFDVDKNKMEIILFTNGIKDYKTDLNFSAVTRENTGQELPVEVVYNDNDIYIIEIDNVQQNFNQLALRLHRSEKELEDVFDEDVLNDKEDNDMFTTIYTDERVVDIKSLKDKDQKEYVIDITNELIDKTQEEKESEEEYIIKVEKVLESLDEEIEELEDELLYQTVDEQVETSNNIYRLENDINDYEKEIEEKETNIKSLQNKVDRLDQKKRDLNI